MGCGKLTGRLVRHLSSLRLRLAPGCFQSLALLLEVDILRLKLLLFLHKLLVGGVKLLRFFQQFLILFDHCALGRDLSRQNLVLLSETLTQRCIVDGRIIGVRRQSGLGVCGGGAVALAKTRYGRDRQQQGTCRKKRIVLHLIP